jgi:hypothetical protein
MSGADKSALGHQERCHSQISKVETGRLRPYLKEKKERKKKKRMMEM